jgi:hypothetical protein
MKYQTRCSNSAVSIGKNIFPNEIMKFLKEIHIHRLELQIWSLEFVMSFSEVYILDLGWRFG